MYVSFLGEEGGNRVRQPAAREPTSSLVELKRAYDSTNFFRLNQNIEPERPAKPQVETMRRAPS